MTQQEKTKPSWIKNPEMIAIIQGLDFNSRRVGRIEGLLANEIIEVGMEMSDLKRARKQRDVYYSRLIKFISQVELNAKNNYLKNKNAVEDIKTILDKYVSQQEGLDSPELVIGKALDYIKRLQDPERKPAWEWFDNVQKKIATEPKLVVKRRGKKHKW